MTASFALPLQVQAAIGAKNAVAFDLTAACSGFVLALVTAAQYIRTGTFKKVLVIGADALSRITDWRDRGKEPDMSSMCVLVLYCACSQVAILSFLHA